MHCVEQLCLRIGSRLGLVPLAGGGGGGAADMDVDSVGQKENLAPEGSNIASQELSSQRARLHQGLAESNSQDCWDPPLTQSSSDPSEFRAYMQGTGEKAMGPQRRRQPGAADFGLDAPVTQEPVETQSGSRAGPIGASTGSKSVCTNLIDNFVPHRSVTGFVWAVLRRVVPKVRC